MIRSVLAGFCAAAAAIAVVTSPTTETSGAGGQTPKPDVVLEWNATALRTTAAAPFDPPLESRNLAIVHAAMFEAVNAIVREFQHYAVDPHPPAGASPEAAAAAAARFVLVRLYPDQQAALEEAYRSSLASIPGGPARESGVQVGETVASELLAMRASDGADAAISTPYSPGTRPGDWNPTPPSFRPALDPGWGSVRTFLLKSGSQFRPGPPPALESRRYARDLEEIRDAGSASSTIRTREEADLATFWVSTAAQVWNPAARRVATAQGRSLSQNARAFALLNLAGADAFIAAWDAKFAYNQWRPVTAIRGAAGDGNAETAADPSWTPLLVTPPFPDYIAGHTAYAGAAAEVLNHVFGRNPGVVMQLTSASAPGVIRTYTTFDDIADDVVDARVWGGIHWRTSSLSGKLVGERIGRYSVQHCLKPRPERAQR